MRFEEPIKLVESKTLYCGEDAGAISLRHRPLSVLLEELGNHDFVLDENQSVIGYSSNNCSRSFDIPLYLWSCIKDPVVINSIHLVGENSRLKSRSKFEVILKDVQKTSGDDKRIGGPVYYTGGIEGKILLDINGYSEGDTGLKVVSESAELVRSIYNPWSNLNLSSLKKD